MRTDYTDYIGKIDETQKVKQELEKLEEIKIRCGKGEGYSSLEDSLHIVELIHDDKYPGITLLKIYPDIPDLINFNEIKLDPKNHNQIIVNFEEGYVQFQRKSSPNTIYTIHQKCQ